MKSKFFNAILFILIMPVLALTVGCGSGDGKTTVTVGGQSLVDPSGNWKMSFTDTNANDLFILSGLYSQSGPVVTGISFSEVGNQAPGFQCAAQPDISMTNGLVQNTNQFSGDLHGNFGTIHFAATLNDPGTHASGTYTVTPPASGNCLGIALSGTFTGDEVPSMTSSAWTGTVTCTNNCPVGSSSGSIAMSLTQNDATGAVTGSYTITGLPAFSTGNIVPDVNNLLSGASIQQKFLDNNGSINFLVGGPLNSLGTAGVGLDRSFHGNLLHGDPTDPLYVVTMSH
jgi:hypothetical protein